MMITLLELLPIALLGGLLGLDVVSFPQAMISRPLVAATLAGAFLGDPLGGLLAGATLEFFALETLPFGASRYPEWGSASVVGGALFVAEPTHPPGSLVMAVLGALATTFVGGWTMVKLRQANARWARDQREALEAGSRGAVMGLQLRGMTADFARGALLTGIALAALGPLSHRVVALWSVDARYSRAIVVGVAASVALGAIWKLVHAIPGARWLFAGGLAIALALVALG
ncbi:MAG TPA: PTS sugar transporter subunit IIC [Gemmatimonadaceae bacterium]